MTKKFLLIVCAMLSITVFGQNGGKINVDSYKKKVSKSDEVSVDPKKSKEPKTWQKRGELFAEIAELPSDGLWVGMTETDLELIMGKPVSTTDTTIAGKLYKKISYTHKVLYKNDESKLVEFWEINNYVIDNPYEKALESYNKVYELDEKQKFTKKLTQNLKTLSEKSFNAGLNEYQVGRYPNARDLFATSVKIAQSPLLPRDSVYLTYAYYAGVLGIATENYQLAYDYLKICIDGGYVSDDLYSNIALAMTKLDMDKELIEQTLMAGYTRNPANQLILIGLINHYLTTNDNPEKILPYLQEAQKLEPGNPSLFLAEGNVWMQVKKYDDAEKAYLKALDIQPDLIDAYYNIGVMYLTQGDNYLEQINHVERSNYKEMDRLDALADESFQKAIEPLEKFLSANPDNMGVLETLKNIYFRFRNKDPQMKAKSEEYILKLKTAKGE